MSQRELRSKGNLVPRGLVVVGVLSQRSLEIEGVCPRMRPTPEGVLEQRESFLRPSPVTGPGVVL